MGEIYTDLEKKPKNFYNTERGSVFGYLIHETNGSVGIIRYWNDKLKKSIEDNKPLPNEEILKITDSIQKSLNRIKDSVDHGYTKFKKLEGY
jgi:hypothetical protein